MGNSQEAVLPLVILDPLARMHKFDDPDEQLRGDPDLPFKRPFQRAGGDMMFAGQKIDGEQSFKPGYGPRDRDQRRGRCFELAFEKFV
ncbi:hypothetical protein ACVW2L_001028 [Mucilaginibacter sp. HD30]